MYERSLGELPAMAAFMNHDDEGHIGLRNYAKLKFKPLLASFIQIVRSYNPNR